MTYIMSTLEEFITNVEGFDQLSTEEINKLSSSQILQPLRYRIGQKIIGKEQLPERIAILYQGNVRLLGYDTQTQLPITLKLLQPGAVIGEIAWLRELPCETAIASTEVVCLTWKSSDYLQFINRNPAFAQARQHISHLIEVFDVLSSQVAQKALVNHNLKDITQQAQLESKIHYLSPGKTSLKELESNRIWFVSGRSSLPNFPPGSRLETDVIEVKGDIPVRLLGITPHDLSLLDSIPIKSEILDTDLDTNSTVDIEIPYAQEQEFVPPTTSNKSSKNQNYPFFRGQGELDSSLACFQMLSKHLEIPFRKEVVRRILNDQIKRQGSISFQVCAYLSELIGLKSQLVDVPAVSINRIPTPALIRYRDSFAVLYAVDGKTVVLGVPSQGIINCQINRLVEELETDEANLQPQVRVLLLSETKETPKERFGLGWFVPYLSRYRRVLIEVFIASFFVQLAALANPLVIQLIIDKVIVQNSISTLNVLGVLLLAVGVFEAVLTTLRTYLFVDTTNRIDMSLGSQIIDHFLRLPLRYFDKRPVGELSTRINELENIRQFLTGTEIGRAHV